MPSNFWPTTFFPRGFHAPNIRTDVEKQKHNYIIVMSFNIQCEKCQLVQHPLAWNIPGHIIYKYMTLFWNIPGHMYLSILLN